MTLPGPSAATWAVELLATALYAVVVGEAVRGPLSRRVPFFRPGDSIERGLLDLYLGGAVFYVLAVVPLGLFGVPALLAIIFLASLSLVPRIIRRRADGSLLAPLRHALRSPSAPYLWLAVLAGLGLLGVELSAAVVVPTGDTWDSSVDSLFVGLLQLHGTVPWRLAPVSAAVVAYPQGSTVWFAIAQFLWSLPPARTVLLVTPLFLALAPLAGFSLGRRVIGTDAGGATFAVALAVFAPGTRYLVGGSNDFVLAFPLVLLLAGRALDWSGAAPPSRRNAAAFGALLGYSAAINPVGAEWIVVLLPVLAVLGGATRRADALRWVQRWLLAVVVGLAWVIPSLAAIVEPGTFPATVLSGTPFSSSAPRYVGFVDPFLFRSTDVALAPDALLRAELAILLTLGLVALVVLRRGLAALLGSLGRWTLAGGLSAALWLGVGLAADARTFPFAAVGPLTSAGEMSFLLFTLYGLVASAALVVLLTVAVRGPIEPRPGPGASRDATPPLGEGPRVWRRRTPAEQRLIAAALALALLVPGVAFTTVRMPDVLGTLYGSFSHVTGADFDLLEYASAHLPNGARVLVA
ncbi:MAG TPA: hypothetical protein VGS18_02145, partial [Thermoplasmata archaeon]|nr:hypothetical protein [Thermoplasmata archaeon]